MQDSFYKPKYNYPGLQKKQKNERLKTGFNESKKIDAPYQHRNMSNVQKKNKNIKKLQLNQDLSI